ncbi:MAG TPA: nucleotidyltransferase family protein [Blastocatellia bacterium]|nr:nucleotidyltransferase family protein [Blastocatellia bacterium]
MVSAILLAAGESRRMGEFKQLLTIEGQTFVARCVDNLLASRAGEVIVVTGHRAGDVRRELEGCAVRFAHNADYALGMSESIKRGVEAVSPESRACLIALVDQPQITTDIFNRVIETYERTRSLVVIPTYNGRNGHPVLLDLTLKDEILAINADQGLRAVVHSHANDISRVEVSSEAVVIDFDLPEDYERITNR